MNINMGKCPETEVSQPFLEGMVNRMNVSFHKYGAVADAKGTIDEIGSLILRLSKYIGSDKLKTVVAALP